MHPGQSDQDPPFFNLIKIHILREQSLAISIMGFPVLLLRVNCDSPKYIAKLFHSVYLQLNAAG